MSSVERRGGGGMLLQWLSGCQPESQPEAAVPGSSVPSREDHECVLNCSVTSDSA